MPFFCALYAILISLNNFFFSSCVSRIHEVVGYAVSHASLYPSHTLNFFLEYGSMLSCASPDSHVRMPPREDATPNELSHRTGTRGTDGEAVSETAAFARQSSMLDADMHWEMNYHEAAIFLEVKKHMLLSFEVCLNNPCMIRNYIFHS